MGDPALALPLDTADLDVAAKWVRDLRESVGVFKIGLELFSAHGPAAVELVQQQGSEIFLDLKLHDIPVTMAKAARAAADLGVRYLTVHACAGRAALSAVADAVRGTDLRILGVTVLTSHDESSFRDAGFAEHIASATESYAALCQSTGLYGVVCSADEVANLSAKGLFTVVPGIRLPGDDAADQRRVATPETALAAGANLLVVGRSITTSRDPRETARAIAATIARHRVIHE